MSSSFRQPIARVDLGLIRTVLRDAGFRYEEPMCDLDRGAARHALRLYQEGVHLSGRLISAVNEWADGFVSVRNSLAVRSVRS